VYPFLDFCCCCFSISPSSSSTYDYKIYIYISNRFISFILHIMHVVSLVVYNFVNIVIDFVNNIVLLDVLLDIVSSHLIDF
jgi:hypothetical protein